MTTDLNPAKHLNRGNAWMQDNEMFCRLFAVLAEKTK